MGSSPVRGERSALVLTSSSARNPPAQSEAVVTFWGYHCEPVRSPPLTPPTLNPSLSLSLSTPLLHLLPPDALSYVSLLPTTKSSPFSPSLALFLPLYSPSAAYLLKAFATSRFQFFSSSSSSSDLDHTSCYRFL